MRLGKFLLVLCLAALPFCGARSDGIRTIPGQGDKLCPACVGN